MPPSEAFDQLCGQCLAASLVCRAWALRRAPGQQCEGGVQGWHPRYLLRNCFLYVHSMTNQTSSSSFGSMIVHHIARSSTFIICWRHIPRLHHMNSCISGLLVIVSAHYHCFSSAHASLPYVACSGCNGASSFSLMIDLCQWFRVQPSSWSSVSCSYVMSSFSPSPSMF